ncbi:MAG TPA: carbon-nitrogen hydrolase family protein [Nocardioides sp.]|uniref:carbon-nitrogen hydrolase family protein n=1 Tax=Nocardioides sp. TaxID=35761 RepID=UPI002ED9F4EB
MWHHLDVALVQQAASLDPGENRRRLAELTPGGVDLVVFPEAFARDFGTAQDGTDDVRPDAEPLDGPFGAELARVAGARSTMVLAGMFEATDGLPYNTLVLTDGERREVYRKIHLYDSFGYRESDRLSAGEVRPVLTEVDGVPIGLLTCYDLRFPELARALVEAGAEVLVVPAAWVAGERKVDHWRTLVRARAIENTAYVVAVGQPAPRYCGHSLVVDPLGEVLVEGGDGPGVLTARLEGARVAEARSVNPSLRNRRM